MGWWDKTKEDQSIFMRLWLQIEDALSGTGGFGDWISWAFESIFGDKTKAKNMGFIEPEEDPLPGFEDGETIYVQNDTKYVDIDKNPEKSGGKAASIPPSYLASKESNFSDSGKFTKAYWSKDGLTAYYQTIDGSYLTKTRSSKQPGRQGFASRAWMNNNPGNIEYGPFARKNGAIGTDGRFAIFASEEAGFEAMAKLLSTSKIYKGLTIAQALSKYAPAHENNVKAYKRALTRDGIDINRRIDSLSKEELIRVTKSMAKHEGWYNNKGGQVHKAPSKQGQRYASISDKFNNLPTEEVAAAGSEVDQKNNRSLFKKNIIAAGLGSEHTLTSDKNNTLDKTLKT